MAAQTANIIHEENEWLVVVMAEHQTGEQLQLLKDTIARRAQEMGHDLDVLVDVSHVKTSDSEANGVAREFFKDLAFKHMAVYGGSRAVNVGIKLILNLFISMGVGEVRLFKSESKARAWLKSVR